MLAFLVPSAAAAPLAPHFVPNVQIDVPPVYRASFFGPSPSIAAGTNGVVYLAFAGWSGATTGDDIDFTMSSDGGRSWSTPIRVNDDAGAAEQAEPSLALAPSTNIFYANSTNGGLSFNPSVRVNDDVTSTEQGQPAIAVAPNRDVDVVWRDPRSAAKGPDIYFSKSSDLGATWSPNIYVNSDVGSAA